MKQNIKKVMLSLFLLTVIILSMNISAFAESAKDFGLTLSKNDSYSKDGLFYMSFNINTGQLPMANDTNTKVKVELFNSAGKRVVNWTEKTFESNKSIKQNYSYDWNKNLPTDTYTMKVTCTLDGNSYSTYSGWAPCAYYWSFKINHTAPSSINLSSTTVVALNDGSYATKISLGHSGSKGKVANLEIYNEWGDLVFSTIGSSPISYDKGTYSFTWGGFPNGGGVKCSSGNYKIKYWVSGGNPKQSTVWLDIY